MRITTFKIIFLYLITVVINYTYAIDTSVEEKTCVDIGFKRKTEAFGNCVLELVSRGGDRSNNLQPNNQAPTFNDPEYELCRKYGFKPNTSEFANCRQQIDLAKQAGQQQQAQYEEQKRQYEEQAKEYQKRRDRAKDMAMLQCGLNLIASGNCAGVQSVGPPPVAPILPNNAPRTYYLPNNRVMTCNTLGNTTNCY